ncbi:MAG: hypothetical protein K9M49_00105 [Candidatus Marinimicrobia bacterium]|nr:hypothetical protein [Candidatus Neomarinimicrobiota bacterium]MCF7903528.1 hypothetical protein [Candidatus Neomarinimicrobiota bacterium]
MPVQATIIWEKIKGKTRTFGFKYSSKIEGIIKQKGLWSTECTGTIGNREIVIKRDHLNKRYLRIYDAKSEKTLARIRVYWKDFQRNRLEFEDGKVYYFKSYDLFRGAWSWVGEDSQLEQFIFRVDGLMHRSGLIEDKSKDLSALERDVLLLLGLNLQRFYNVWLMTIAIILILIITDH